MTVTAVATCLALLLAASGVHAQHRESDPRHAEDPRETRDPREVPDPRDVGARRDQGKPRSELQGRELLETLHAEGARSTLSDAMRSEGWALLDWIHEHCEAWLKRVEAGALESEQGRAEVAELAAEAADLAQLADAALGDTRFAKYVQDFTGWDAEQRATYRAGQDSIREASTLFEEAGSAGQALEALTPLERAFDHARRIGDLWGMSTALAAKGRVFYVVGRLADARDAMRQAVDVGRQIRDLDAVWYGLNVIYDTSMDLDELDAAHEALHRQYEIALELGDERSAGRVLGRIIYITAEYERRERRRPPIPPPYTPALPYTPPRNTPPDGDR